jgi:hypothetical protein
MRKTFLEQLLLSNNVDYISRPIQPVNSIEGVQPNQQQTQPQQKPMSRESLDRFGKAMAPPSELAPESTNTKTDAPNNTQKMSFLEKMRINQKLKGSSDADIS